MKNHWPIKTIAECAANEPYSTQIGPFGKALMADEYTPTGVPVLRGVNVNRGRFHDDDFVFISEETADRLSKFESHPDDVLLVHKGTLGEIGLMPKQRKYRRYIMGNSMMRVRCDPEKLLPQYLYYWLSSQQGRHYLLSRVSQVGVPQIQRPLTTLREARLQVPPIEEQRAIAHVLGTLDDKIELNRRMNETLEAIAQALFVRQFVQPAIVGVQTQWKTESLTDLTEVITKGTTPTRGDVSGAPATDRRTTYVRVNAISEDGSILEDKLITIPETVHSGLLKRSILKCGDLLYTIAGTIGRIAMVEESLLPANCNQAVAIVRPKSDIPPGFLLLSMRQPSFQEELHSNVVHAVQANLSLGMLSRAKIACPNRDTLYDMFQPINKILKRIAANRAESRTVTALRDALLPKLLSGQVAVTLSKESLT